MSEPNFPIPTSTVEYYRFLPRPTAAPRDRYWLHGLLLAATVLTTLIVGARMQFNFQHNLPLLSAGNGFIPFFPVEWTLRHPSRLLLGVPFSATLLAILLSHEMGHYLACRFYGVRATLPFFIPAPTVIGTLGAVIRIKAPIRTRAALFDIGIAGPIAGFVVGLGTLFAALNLSKPLATGIPAADLQLGLPQIFYLIQQLLRAVAPGHAISALPLARVYLHPTAIAAWVGMYATALNLLPSGQLDGGHIVYALVPRAHRAISWITVAALVYLGWVAHRMDSLNYGWWFWAMLIAIMNVLTYRQEQAPEFPMIPANRWLLALAGAAMLALTFTVSPFKAT